MINKQRLAQPMALFPPIFAEFWKTYTKITPRAAKIFLHLHDVLNLNVANDHIAFRTVSHPSVDCKALEKLLNCIHYVRIAEYAFPNKHLKAIHLEYKPNPDNDTREFSEDCPPPKIFISQLQLNEVSPFMQERLLKYVENIPDSTLNCWDIFTRGNPEKPDYETYTKLLIESEYGAWLYIHGIIPNHFTVSINHLWPITDDEVTDKHLTLEELNKIIEGQGWPLNKPEGRAIQGGEEDLLQQSSTLAEPRFVTFKDNIAREVPSCYYEFAYRKIDPTTGALFQGFITKNADKLFHSTDTK